MVDPAVVTVSSHGTSPYPLGHLYHPNPPPQHPPCILGGGSQDREKGYQEPAAAAKARSTQVKVIWLLEVAL